MPRHIINTVFAALLAMSIAMRLGLPMPQIAMVSVFIVMQPVAQQVFAKSVYRMIGTVAGAAASWGLAAMFAQTPASFLTAIGVWVTLFTVAAAFSQQLRAYSIVLTGYTPLLIGIPAVFELQHIGIEAIHRLAEVTLGISCAAAVVIVDALVTRRLPPHAAMDSPPAPQGAKTDIVRASIAGLHPAIAMLAMATLWLTTSWRGGAMATLNATVDCALVALAASPLRGAFQMSVGTLAAIVVGVVLQWSYPLLPVSPCLLLIPAMAVGAWMTGRSHSLIAGLGYSITLCMIAYPYGSSSDQYLYDAAGLTLSVVVLSAISAILWPLRQRNLQP